MGSKVNIGFSSRPTIITKLKIYAHRLEGRKELEKKAYHNRYNVVYSSKYYQSNKCICYKNMAIKELATTVQLYNLVAKITNAQKGIITVTYKMCMVQCTSRLLYIRDGNGGK